MLDLRELGSSLVPNISAEDYAVCRESKPSSRRSTNNEFYITYGLTKIFACFITLFTDFMQLLLGLCKSLIDLYRSQISLRRLHKAFHMLMLYLNYLSPSDFFPNHPGALEISRFLHFDDHLDCSGPPYGCRQKIFSDFFT